MSNVSAAFFNRFRQAVIRTTGLACPWRMVMHHNKRHGVIIQCLPHDNPYIHKGGIYPTVWDKDFTDEFGRIAQVISSQGDYKRNEIATKRPKDKYGLTYADDKSKTNVDKLRPAERVKYEIHNAGKRHWNEARHGRSLKSCWRGRASDWSSNWTAERE